MGGAEAGRPKRYSRELAVWARGGAVTPPDDRLADVLFLDQHPTWTWRDLQETPEDVLVLLGRLERERARAAKEAK